MSFHICINYQRRRRTSYIHYLHYVLFSLQCSEPGKIPIDKIKSVYSFNLVYFDDHVIQVPDISLSVFGLLFYVSYYNRRVEQ